MQIKVKEWPKVIENDYGIRPAGEPDECFYCRAKIGQFHSKECVCATKIVKYNVLIGRELAFGNYKGVKVGEWQRHDPHFWTPYLCTSHKNKSSWCKDNALDNIVWLEDEFSQAVKKKALELTETSCCCSFLAIEFAEVVDEGPFVEIREDEARQEGLLTETITRPSGN